MASVYPWQSALWQSLQDLRGRLPHALLIKGAQGIGKREIAAEFARSLLCEQRGADGTACGACPSCHWLAQESHPDFRLIQPEALSASDESGSEDESKKSKQISVDQIRSLVHFSNLTAHQGGLKVILIHPAEAMNLNAANALLKTLEEPPHGVLFILVSHKPQQLLPTIRSRCLALSAVPPTKEESVFWLESQGVVQPESWLARAGFAPVAAQALAESGGEGKEYTALLQSLSRPDQLDAIAVAEHLQRAEPAKVILLLQQWTYDLIDIYLARQVRYFAEQTAQLGRLAQQADLYQLLQFQRELNEARRVAGHPLNPRLVFETLLYSYQKVFFRATRHAVH
ncbi:MAG: DNA polymerase III subunit delta' [Pseudomonadota bacterium]